MIPQRIMYNNKALAFGARALLLLSEKGSPLPVSMRIDLIEGVNSLKITEMPKIFSLAVRNSLQHFWQCGVRQRNEVLLFQQ